MATAAALVVVASALLLLFMPPGEAQESSGRHGQMQAAHPHGLPFESPLALSPAAYEFFHPSERGWLGHVAPALAPLGQQRGSVLRGDGASAASVARADQEEGGVGVAPVKQSRRGGAARAGAVASVFVGAAVVVVAALVLAYAVARRRVAHGDAETAGSSKSNA